MPTYNDVGIILRSFDLSETDKILNIYTKENGLVRAIAKNAKKPTSKIAGKVDQLFCSYFQFAKGKNLDIISDIEQVTCFPKLRMKSTLLFYGILFLEIVNDFASEGESESKEIYKLLYSSLDELQTTINPEFTSLKFILNFLSVHGFKPQLDTCVSCSKNISSPELRAQSLELRTQSSELKAQSSRLKALNYAYSSILGGLLCDECLNIEHKMIPHDVLYSLTSANEATNLDLLRASLKLLQEHLNARAKNEIKSFELVLSL